VSARFRFVSRSSGTPSGNRGNVTSSTPGREPQRWGITERQLHYLTWEAGEGMFTHPAGDPSDGVSPRGSSTTLHGRQGRAWCTRERTLPSWPFFHGSTISSSSIATYFST
jgi:hypothetical protein